MILDDLTWISFSFRKQFPVQNEYLIDLKFTCAWVVDYFER